MYNRPTLMIPQLGADPAAPFPDTAEALANPDGLLAWGGDLDPVRLVNAYHQGIFPWYSDGQPILWWSPSRRCIFRPQHLQVSRRLQRTINQGKFTITADQAFEQVIAGCALPRKTQDSTWIMPEMIDAYCRLYRMGIAHSIEAWRDGELAGGLYGMSLGRVFFGESMFSRVRDASKVVIARLCRQLHDWGYAMFDCQLSNPHLLSLGAVEIPRERFLATLRSCSEIPGPKETFKQAFGGRP